MALSEPLDLFHRPPPPQDLTQPLNQTQELPLMVSSSVSAVSRSSTPKHEALPQPDLHSSDSSTTSQQAPPIKRRRLHFNKILEKKGAEILEKQKRPKDLIQLQVDRYVNNIKTQAPDEFQGTDPLNYWINHFQKKPLLLALVAIDVLTAPVFSAPAE